MADDKVVDLRGRPAVDPAKPTPVPEVVELFRELLARAQSGEITAAAVALVKTRGIASMWTTEGTENNRTQYAMLAAVSQLDYNMNASLSSVSE